MAAPQLSDAQVQSVLDFDQELNVEILDAIMQYMTQGQVRLVLQAALTAIYPRSLLPTLCSHGSVRLACPCT